MTAAKHPGGRPAMKFTDEQRELVSKAASVGIPQERIAHLVGCSENTLRKHCKKELDTGSTLANMEVAKALFDKAIGGDTTAMIWWTKARMGWKETRHNEVEAKGDQPIVYKIVTGVSKDRGEK